MSTDRWTDTDGVAVYIPWDAIHSPIGSTDGPHSTTPSKISQTGKDKCCMSPKPVWNRKEPTHRDNRLVVVRGRKTRVGKGGTTGDANDIDGAAQPRARAAGTKHPRTPPAQAATHVKRPLCLRLIFLYCSSLFIINMLI